LRQRIFLLNLATSFLGLRAFKEHSGRRSSIGMEGSVVANGHDDKALEMITLLMRKGGEIIAAKKKMCVTV